MSRLYKADSVRHLSIPTIKSTRKIESSQLKNDLDFLSGFGFISPKFLSKRGSNQKVFVSEKKKRSQLSSPLEMAEAVHDYFEYKDCVKPVTRNLGYLCPVESINVYTPVPSSLPKRLHKKYIRESMNSLKTTSYRIKKAKEYLTLAKQLSKRYN